ncbi:MAG TPA: hypothetical protein DCL80_01545, partial [Balneola sp.]|nr:hypothetical protein [Balneola sp.]
MFKKNVLNISFLLVLLSVFLFVPAEKVKAQNQIVALEIDINDILSNSQFIGLTNLGLDSEGRGPVLVSGYIQNLTNEVVTDLYIEVKVFAGKIGEIVNVTSRPGFPFSLQPTQSVYINNNTLSEDGVQGISDKVKFDGGLTTEGDEFIESLDGSTTLPADIYSIEIIVFQNTNENGRVDLASISAEIGGAVPVS